MKLRVGDDHMLAIGTPKRSLVTAFFKAFHPDSDTIGVPIQDLDPVEAVVEEHEQAAVAYISIQVTFDDPKEPIEALAHIDGLGVQVDGNRGVGREHLV